MMPGSGPRAQPSVLSVLRHTMVFQLRQQHILSAVIPGCVVPAALCLATLLARGPHSLLTARQIELGCGVLALWSCAIWQTGLILREELAQGTLPGILTRRTGLGTVLFGKTLGTALRCALLIAVTIGCVGLLTGEPLRIADPAVFVLAALATFGSALVLGALLQGSGLFVLTALSATAFGLAVAAVAALHPASPVLTNLAVYALLVLCGIIAPIDRLIAPVRWVSQLLPLTHGAQSLRALADGRPWAAQAALEALVGAAWLVAGLVLLHRNDRRARRLATDGG